MRFLLFDRVTALEKGRRISGLKSISLADEALRGHFSREPLFPCTMVMESMFQLLGWAVIHAHDFELSAIICLSEGVSFRASRLRPGFLAEIGGEIVSTSATDSLCRAWVDVEGARIASIDRLIFRHLRPVDGGALRRVFAMCSGDTPELIGGKAEDR